MQKEPQEKFSRVFHYFYDILILPRGCSFLLLSKWGLVLGPCGNRCLVLTDLVQLSKYRINTEYFTQKANAHFSTTLKLESSLWILFHSSFVITMLTSFSNLTAGKIISLFIQLPSGLPHLDVSPIWPQPVPSPGDTTQSNQARSDWTVTQSSHQFGEVS